ncbi:MAG TPA: HIT domain-containing protein [Candidatus Binataceae bacterium]|nr:HIT domain-containing protein [Candidatus Binataceae bacterium]
MAPKTRTNATRITEANASPAGVRIWAPWRYSYLRKATQAPQQCIFCFDSLTAAERRRRLILFDNDRAVIMLNLYPYTGGHLMVAPRRHVASPELMKRDERALLTDLVAASVARIRKALKPHGINLGANLGRAAGAGFAEHMHWHIVPRWDGDNNFMPALASARVVSQSLEDSYRQLKPFFKNIGAEIS